MVVPTAPDSGSTYSTLAAAPDARRSLPGGSGASNVLNICFSFSAASGENRPTSAEIAAKPKKLTCAAVPVIRPPRRMT